MAERKLVQMSNSRMRGQMSGAFINLDENGLVQEVGNQAVWSLSSCKPGYGVEQLRDNSKETYWQSDGPQPHMVNIEFRRKTTILDICLFADYKLDESYTPSKISIRAGTHYLDLHEIEIMELTEPSGWSVAKLIDQNEKPIRASLIQIAVLSNHQNGRDTHIRQIKIHSPVREDFLSPLFLENNFKSVDFIENLHIR